MKLKAFNQSNLPVMPTGKPTIRFSKSAGLITFSKQAGINLKFTDDTRVELCQNEDVPTDWYVHITTSKSGFAMRRKDDSSSYTFNATPLVRKVLETVKIEKAASFIISGEPEVIDGEKYYYIITGNPIAVK